MTLHGWYTFPFASDCLSLELFEDGMYRLNGKEVDAVAWDGANELDRAILAAWLRGEYASPVEAALREWRKASVAFS
jgi:hypothetical protein